jgi:hypothetical protein
MWIEFSVTLGGGFGWVDKFSASLWNNGFGILRHCQFLATKDIAVFFPEMLPL